MRVLASGRMNYWTGDEARAFEREYAEALGRRHAIALHNGTLALELALHAFGVGPGDEVITTARTFIATVSAVVMRGATPVIEDRAQGVGVQGPRQELTRPSKSASTPAASAACTRASAPTGASSRSRR